ncbi:MAG: HEAT repeat domain-containing protein [Planctomycetota bacterium]|nr:HEAT repeat domain-containing protein [Planctomycetota bacterium]
MLARPLYDDKKPQVKFAPKTKGRPPAGAAPHLVLLAVPLLLVLCIGGALAARHLRNAEQEAAAAEPAAAETSESSQAAVSSPGALPLAPMGASERAPMAPALAPAKPAAPELPELDEFRAPVLSETDAAARMKRILELLDKGSSYEKAAACRALVNMRDFGARQLPAAIAAANERALPWLCDAAAELKAAEAVRPMVVKALADPAKIPNNLVAALGKLGGAESREFCLQSMKQDRYPVLRQWAWEAFADCAKAEDLPMLTETLEKGEDYQRENAAAALGRLARAPETAAQLARHLEARLGALKGAERVSIARAVVELPASHAQSMLAGLSRDADPQVRILAIQGLGRDPFVAGMLCSMLQLETDERVQVALMKALAEAPQAEAVPDLLRLIDSNAYDVSKAAQKALIAAYGVDYGYRAAPWKSWLGMGEAEGDRNRVKLFQSLERKRQAERLAALQAEHLVSGN